ncbi:hypothetical protein G3A39_38555 [Paraburkholderia aspalathi]|nr:hypothetical protein [Paraburkholderia aspalathi]
MILTAKAAFSMEHDQANLSQVVLILALILGVVLALMLIGVFSKMATAEFHRALVFDILTRRSRNCSRSQRRREDMSEAIKPLILAWTDVVCTSMLSLPEITTATYGLQRKTSL